MAARKKKLEPAVPTRDLELLAAIRAAPEDDAPRLVYADHLLESSDAQERERGEFIIAQCATARLPKQSEEWRRARRRELALRTSVATRPKEQLWGAFEWVRGLPSGVSCAPGLLRKAVKLLAPLPIDRLALHPSRQHRAEPTLGDIAWAARALPQVESILIADRHVSATLATKHLEAFDENNTARAMHGWPHRALHDAITAFMIEGDGRGHMEEHFPRLEQLSVRSIGPHVWGWLADVLLERLTLHRDGDDRLFGRDLVHLRTFPILERLTANVRLDRELASAIETSALEELTLQHDATDAALADFVPPPSLRHLTLHFSGGAWHDRTPETVRYRLPPGEYPKLESLELGRFIIDESFAALSFPSLYRLELVECHVEPSGVAALTKLDGLFRPTFLRCVISNPDALRERWPDAVLID